MFEWLSPQELSLITNEPFSRLERIAEQPQLQYRSRIIRSRRGKRRPLLIPHGRLRRIQDCINRGLITRMRPHRNSGCVKGRGVLWAARRHCWHPAVANLDIADFYPSASTDRVLKRLLETGTPLETASVLSRLVTVEDQLPQGAPTSPAVGEILLYPLDIRLTGAVDPLNIVYTRYADDLTFSGGIKRTKRIYRFAQNVAQQQGWSINNKGAVVSGSKRKVVLGLTVNREPSISGRYIRDLHRLIVWHKEGKFPLSERQLRRLRGRINWVKYVMPGTGRRLAVLLGVALTSVR